MPVSHIVHNPACCQDQCGDEYTTAENDEGCGPFRQLAPTASELHHHPYIHLLALMCIHARMYVLTGSRTHLLGSMLTRSLACSLTLKHSPSVTHSPARSLPHALAHSLHPSLTHTHPLICLSACPADVKTHRVTDRWRRRWNAYQIATIRASIAIKTVAAAQVADTMT